jgi:hypothetical protein
MKPLSDLVREPSCSRHPVSSQPCGITEQRNAKLMERDMSDLLNIARECGALDSVRKHFTDDNEFVFIDIVELTIPELRAYTKAVQSDLVEALQLAYEDIPGWVGKANAALFNAKRLVGE